LSAFSAGVTVRVPGPAVTSWSSASSAPRDDGPLEGADAATIPTATTAPMTLTARRFDHVPCALTGRRELGKPGRKRQEIQDLDSPIWENRRMPPENVTLDRLEDQIEWYGRKSSFNQRRFKVLKAAQLLTAAAIPVVATLDLHAAVAAALGASIVVIEGLIQLNQYQQNWVSYRSTCEALLHEKYLYLAHAGPYAEAADGGVPMLADRIEGLISQEG